MKSTTNLLKRKLLEQKLLKLFTQLTAEDKEKVINFVSDKDAIQKAKLIKDKEERTAFYKQWEKTQSN